MDSGLLTDYIVFIAGNFLKTLECLHSIGGNDEGRRYGLREVELGMLLSLY